MNLLPPAQELLKDLYNRYLSTGELCSQINYPSSIADKRQVDQTIQHLVTAGYVEKSGVALGFVLVALTKSGIEYCEINL